MGILKGTIKAIILGIKFSGLPRGLSAKPAIVLAPIALKYLKLIALNSGLL